MDFWMFLAKKSGLIFLRASSFVFSIYINIYMCTDTHPSVLLHLLAHICVHIEVRIHIYPQHLSVSKSVVIVSFAVYPHSLKRCSTELTEIHTKPWFLPLKMQSCHSFFNCFRSKLQQREGAGVNKRERATEQVIFLQYLVTMLSTELLFQAQSFARKMQEIW